MNVCWHGGNLFLSTILRNNATKESLNGHFCFSGSVLAPHLLKSRTDEFDLESISFLDLSGTGRYMYMKYIVGV